VSRPDDGAGVVSTFIGAIIFLCFMLFAAQLLLGLYVTSVVGAVTYDAAASAAAGSSVDSSGARAAIALRAREQLGRLGPSARFEWDVSVDAVRLTVRVRRPAVLPGLLPGVSSDVVRTVRVRAERVR
jgi:hypothetical protein